MFPVEAVRARFPALSVADGGLERVYFDTPAGTQVPTNVIERTTRYFERQNANCGGYFSTSVETDAVLEAAHSAMADLIGAASGDEVIFGQNMTSLTFAVSRSLAHHFKAGDEIILTRMDHDANVSPWLLMARDLGLEVRWLPFNTDTYRFDLRDLESITTDRTRFAAINYASNALGTVNDVKAMCAFLSDRGVTTYIDGVQFVPHRLADVVDLGCDFFVCSAYKFYGPHQGILWGRREKLDELDPYKVRPADNKLPHRFETGTLSHEGIAGTLGAIEYLEWLAAQVAPATASADRRTRLAAAMDASDQYEQVLCRRLIDGLTTIKGITVHGIVDAAEMHDRVPTVCVAIDDKHPDDIARSLAADNVFVWSGHYYAVEVIKHLGLTDAGGMVRIGLAHYHTEAEVDRCLDAIARAA